MCFLELPGVPHRGEKNSSHVYKTGCWYVFGPVLFKICDENPHPPDSSSLPPGGGGEGGLTAVK